MKNQTKKVLQKTGVILAMVMLFTMLAVPAWADETGSGTSSSAVPAAVTQRLLLLQATRTLRLIQSRMLQEQSSSALKKGRNAVLSLRLLTRVLPPLIS
ncbi:MAG: hypothetical protein ACLRZH_08425 [Ruthenibacterium lactatiformans]